MKVELDGNDCCRYWVTSESEPGVKYIVDLCEIELGLDKEGIPEFNGVCGLTNERIHGCRDFAFRCIPLLKHPENKGKVFRCKHIRAAESYALKLLKPYMRAHRVNTHEDSQP